MIGEEARAELLLEAMPYIEKYQNRILVIKYGGNAMLGDEFKWSVMRDLTLLRFVGIKIVLVHGGGPEISQTLERMGIQSRFVNGLRYTDEQTAEVVRMVLAGKVNKEQNVNRPIFHRSMEVEQPRAVGKCQPTPYIIVRTDDFKSILFCIGFQSVLLCSQHIQTVRPIVSSTAVQPSPF